MILILLPKFSKDVHLGVVMWGDGLALKINVGAKEYLINNNV
jgi:hypothetical protein